LIVYQLVTTNLRIDSGYSLAAPAGQFRVQWRCGDASAATGVRDCRLETYISPTTGDLASLKTAQATSTISTERSDSED